MDDDGQFLVCALRGHFGEREQEAAGDALTTAQCFPEPDEHDVKAVADLTVQTLKQWELADTTPARFEKSASEIDIGDLVLFNEVGFQEVLFKAWADDDWGDNGEPTPAVLVWLGSTNLTAPLRLPALSTVEIHCMNTGDLAAACERISNQTRSSRRTEEEAAAAMFDAMTTQVEKREACEIEVGDMLRCYDGVGEWFEEVIFTALSDEFAEATEVLMWTVRSKTTDPIRMHGLATAWVFSPGHRGPQRQQSGDLAAPEEDYYVCLCGNRPHEEGYQPVDHSGHETRPGPEWSGLIRCGRCDRLIDTTTRDHTTGTARVAY